jgi:hypothetical protein
MFMVKNSNALRKINNIKSFFSRSPCYELAKINI